MHEIMQFEYLERVLQESPGIRLLKAANAAMIMSFLYGIFRKEMRSTVPLSVFLQRLEAHLQDLNARRPGSYPRSAQAYLNEWCDEEHRFLRVLWAGSGDNSNEFQIALTAEAERTLSWLETLEELPFIGTESRFLQIVQLLREMDEQSTTNPQARIARLEEQRREIERQIARISQSGRVQVLNDRQLAERFLEVRRMARDLLHDFRRVEGAFRKLADAITQASLQQEVHKGNLVHQVQIKHNHSRHEKDDRTPLGNPRDYVLGWDNTQKRLALAHELAASKQQLERHAAELQALKDEQEHCQQQRDQLRRLLDIEAFARLDWPAVDRECQRLLHEMEQWRDRADHLKQLKAQLAALQKAVQEKDETLHQREQPLGRLQRELEHYQDELAACQRQLLQAPPLTAEGSERARARIERDLKNERVLSLDTLDEIKQRLAKTYQQSLRPLKGDSEKMAEQIRERMRAFLETDPALRQQLDDSLAALPDYRRCYERLQKDDLPRHRAGFKALLNEKVVTSITGFQAALQQHEREIRESLDVLNTALAAVPYSASSYLQLRADLARNQEIQEFRRALRACIPDAGQLTPESYHACFERIQDLLKRLQSEEAWAQRVTDVRNWLEFRAEECRRGTIAIFGSGFQVTLLEKVTWLKACPLFYWGDLDAQGFQILAALRSSFPHAIAVMMDEETLARFAAFQAPGTPCAVRQLPSLGPEEQALFTKLAEGNIRLEQERIAWAYACQRLQEYLQP